MGRRLVVLGLLVLLALMRAEHGLAELQGQTSVPSRMFRLVPAGDGRWFISFLGLQTWLDARIPVLEFQEDEQKTPGAAG